MDITYCGYKHMGYFLRYPNQSFYTFFRQFGVEGGEVEVVVGGVEEAGDDVGGVLLVNQAPGVGHSYIFVRTALI